MTTGWTSFVSFRTSMLFVQISPLFKNKNKKQPYASPWITSCVYLPEVSGIRLLLAFRHYHTKVRFEDARYSWAVWLLSFSPPSWSPPDLLVVTRLPRCTKELFPKRPCPTLWRSIKRVVALDYPWCLGNRALEQCYAQIVYRLLCSIFRPWSRKCRCLHLVYCGCMHFQLVALMRRGWYQKSNHELGILE